MLKNTIVVGQTKLDYFIHGQDPKLLLDSGTHGDEYDIIPLVENSVKKYLNQLPSFIYIPQISPSSVALKARNNKDNLNINRSYFTNSEVEEIKAVQKIIENYHFDLSVTFHEDLFIKDFYMYDSQTFDHEVSFLAFKEKILRAGVGLYNGYDSDYDPLAVGDVVLGWKVVDGYVPNNPAADINEDGQFAAWSLARKVIKRVINPEIPGKADLKIKQKVIDLVFEDLILKLF